MTMFLFSLYWYCLERFFCLLAVLLPASQDVVDSKSKHICMDGIPGTVSDKSLGG